MASNEDFSNTFTYVGRALNPVMTRNSSIFLRNEMEKSEVSGLLRRALREQRTVSYLFMNEIDFKDIHYKTRVETLFHRRKFPWLSVEFDYCTGPIGELIADLLAETSAQPQTLRIRSREMDQIVAPALATSLAKANTGLKSLVMCGSTLSADSVQLILQGLKGNTEVESIRFNNCTFGEGAKLKLALHIIECNSIKRLELFNCGWHDAVAVELLHTLQANHTKLEHLDLGSNKCTTTTLVAVGELLRTTESLCTLNLSLQSDPEGMGLDLSPLANGLTENQSLKELYLRGNRLQEDGFVHLMHSVARQSSRLEKLMLTDCKLSLPFLEVFLEKLRDMPRLRSIWLDGCQSFGVVIKKPTWTALLDCVRANMSLEHFQLPFGFVQSRDELDHILNLNLGGRRLLIRNDSVPHSLWPQVLGRINAVRLHSHRPQEGDACARVNMLYYFLRQRILLEE